MKTRRQRTPKNRTAYAIMPFVSPLLQGGQVGAQLQCNLPWRHSHKTQIKTALWLRSTNATIDHYAIVWSAPDRGVCLNINESKLDYANHLLEVLSSWSHLRCSLFRTPPPIQTLIGFSLRCPPRRPRCVGFRCEACNSVSLRHNSRRSGFLALELQIVLSTSLV